MLPLSQPANANQATSAALAKTADQCNPYGLPVTAARARVGTTVEGRWHIDALIAVGGSSVIYAASHRNGMRVAMKVLDSELADNATAVSHFLCEGRAVNAIQHPGVVNVLDEGTMADGAPFLLMPLLVGETAQQRLARHPAGLPVAEALAIVDVVLDVLSAAHARGIVHRDLKPDNIFLEASGAVRVLDFGIAQDSNNLDITQHGTVVGTAGYLPPEQARGRVREAGPRSDVWSVGAMLYTLLSGKVLHEAPTVIASILRAQSEPVPPARVLISGVADSVAQVLDGALGFDATDRWMNAAAMRFAVRAALDEVRCAAVQERLLSFAGVTVESLAARSSPSDVPVAFLAADRLRATRKPLAWLAALCVAAAWVVVAAFFSHARPSLPVLVAAAAPPATVEMLPPPETEHLAPLPAEVEELSPASPMPAASTTTVPSAQVAPPQAPKAPGKAHEIVRQLQF
jgi:serine/threonine-protein kinase